MAQWPFDSRPSGAGVIQAFFELSMLRDSHGSGDGAVAEHKDSHTNSRPSTRTRSVDWSTELETVRQLLQDYRDWVFEHADPAPGRDSDTPAGVRQIDAEIAALPGGYGPPRGDVVLAFAPNGLAACGALRELEPRLGEMRRVYIRGDHRGPGFGTRFTRVMLDRAAQLGYERVRVDTLPTMSAAIQFYQDAGFKPIPRYWPHPAAGALFFERSLP